MENWTAESYLAHHGILGQKWGKKNGPPYPLAPGEHSAAEKKAGWRKSLDGGSGENPKKKKKMSKETKKAVAGMAATAAGAMAASVVLADQNIRGKDGKPKKKASDLTDDELKELNKREGMERQYNKNFGTKSEAEVVKEIADIGTRSINSTKKRLDDEIAKRPTFERMDLSHMTNQELQNAINRENLEIQYSKLFNQVETVSKGEEYVKTILDVAGTALGATASALGIALAIKALKK